MRTIILWFGWRTLQRKNSFDPQPEPQAGGGRDAQLALCGEAGGGDAGLLWMIIMTMLVIMIMMIISEPGGGDA